MSGPAFLLRPRLDTGVWREFACYLFLLQQFTWNDGSHWCQAPQNQAHGTGSYACHLDQSCKEEEIIPSVCTFNNELSWQEVPDCSNFSITKCDQNSLDRGQSRKKTILVNFRGPDWRRFSELCVLLFFLGKTHNMLPKSQFSKPIFGHPAGSTKLDWPHCKQFQCENPPFNLLKRACCPCCFGALLLEYTPLIFQCHHGEGEWWSMLLPETGVPEVTMSSCCECFSFLGGGSKPSLIKAAGYGQSTESDPSVAVTNALRDAGVTNPSMAIIACTVAHDAQKVAQSMHLWMQLFVL